MQRRVVLGIVLSCSVGAAYAQEPAACDADGGLDFYRCRADDFQLRHPDLEVPDYYLDYADRYLRRFTFETRRLLSPRGQAWVDQVRLELQRAVEVERAADPAAFAALERDREAFLDFAYETHPAAYDAAGIDELPLRDLLLIGSTPDLQDLFSRRGRDQIMEVVRGLVGACEAEGPLACAADRVMRELRERHRLIVERLRLRATGTLGGWLVRRIVGSAERELRALRGATGLRGQLEELPQATD